MENNPNAKAEEDRPVSSGDAPPPAPGEFAPQTDKDEIFVQSIRKRLAKGKIIAVIPLMVAIVVIVVMYYAMTVFRKSESANYLILTTGLVLGFCMAVVAWAIYTAVLAIVGSKAERLMIKYHDLAADKNSSAQDESGQTSQGRLQAATDNPKPSE